jgi:hypothetical protein
MSRDIFIAILIFSISGSVIVAFYIFTMRLCKVIVQLLQQTIFKKDILSNMYCRHECCSPWDRKLWIEIGDFNFCPHCGCDLCIPRLRELN